MKEVGSFIKRDAIVTNKIETIKKELLSNQKLLSYLKAQNIKLSEEKLENSLMNLIHFYDNSHKCENCQGLSTCTQENKGFKPNLRDAGNFIHLQLSHCDYQKAYEAQLSVAKHLRSFFMPKKILNASFDALDITTGRTKVISKLATFAKSYDPNKFQKGMYLYGPFGVGKTYLLAAMANELAKRNIEVAFVYLPDMIRELKSAIGNNNLEHHLSEIKGVKVLILDDIGSEMNTQWVRDEIMGPILQYRMLEELPTFFSSNKSMDELISDYATTNDNVKDETKAKRMGDRIKALADEMMVTGKNYRY